MLYWEQLYMFTLSNQQLNAIVLYCAMTPEIVS